MEKSNHYRVLVVDDDQELSVVMSQILKSIDPKVEIDLATSAEEAVEQLHYRDQELRGSRRERPYDLIVADIYLEGRKSGLELLESHLQDYPKIPVLVTSGMPLDRFLKAYGRDSVCPPFMQKPFSVGECRQMFEGLLAYGQDRYFPA